MVWLQVLDVSAKDKKEKEPFGDMIDTVCLMTPQVNTRFVLCE